MVLWSPGVCSCLCWPCRGLGLSREDTAYRLQKRKMSVSCPVREYTQRSRHTCPSLTETDPGHCSSVAGTHELHLIVGRRHNDAHVKHLQRGEESSQRKRRTQAVIGYTATHGASVSKQRWTTRQQGSCRARCGKGNAVLCWVAVINFGKMRRQKTAKWARRAPTVCPVGRIGVQFCPSFNHQSTNSVVRRTTSVMHCFPLGVSLWDFIPFCVKAHVAPDLKCSLSVSYV